MSRFTFTSESVSEGHPDKVCDYISDSVLDACFEQDPRSRVACETLVKSDHVVLAGEITTNAKLDFEKIVRQAVKEIGYTDTSEPFCDTTLKIVQLITKQSNEISQGVTETTSQSGDQGAGDQGIMFGYATDESPEMMPLPILLAHKLMKAMADDRHAGKYTWLRPDSKSQVSLNYDGNDPRDVTAVVVSTQHTAEVDQKRITEYVREELGPKALGNWWNKSLTLFVNPTGSFIHGGRRPTPASPAARSSSTATAAGAVTAAARSAARTPRKSIAAAPTSAATSPSRSSRRDSRRRRKSRSATRSAWRSQCRSRSIRSAPVTNGRPLTS